MPPWRRSPRSTVPSRSSTSQPVRTGASARVQAVVDGATGLRGAVDRVADAGTRIEEGLAAVEDRVDRAQANVDLVMWITTVVLLLLVAYVALLNWLLLRGYRR
jgi:hypothetical protein